jgi:HEAT repeat protein
MCKRSFLVPVTIGLLATGIFAGKACGAEDDAARLRAALLPTDNEGLVKFFRLRARGEPTRGSLKELIEALHSETPATRQQACAELVAIGTLALPLLRSAAREPEGAATTLAERCLKAIETDGGTLTAAAIHLLARHRPPGSPGVLLDYLSHAENELVREEIQNALIVVAYDGKGAADPSVVKALSDKHPLRRKTALIALAQGSISQYHKPVRKLLRDPAPSVRLRAALALGQGADPEAIESLIDLLGEVADQHSLRMIEIFLADLAGGLAPKVDPGDDETARRNARAAWAKWWRDTEKMGLLDELKKRTMPDADIEDLHSLIRKLGHNNFHIREKAEKDLIQLGPRYLALLRMEAQKNRDAEVRLRTQRVVAAIEKAKAKEQASPLVPTIARLIALRKPPGAAEVILAYLPSLDDDGLVYDLQNALNAVAFSDGKPQPAILKGLNDKSGMRRVAAAQALCAGPRGDHLKAVRALLRDPEPSVRLKVTLALAAAGDHGAVPVLIAQVAELPAELSGQAESHLSLLAGDAGPKDLPDGDDNRKKRSQAWSAWWQTNKGKVVLFDPSRAASPTGYHGYTLLVQPQADTVAALGLDGKPLWTLTGLAAPSDAVVLPGQRVLVVEQNRVTERDVRGKILWQKEINQPLNAHRLRNGNTFIACANQLIEVDRAGKEVMKIALVAGIAAARKLPDGRIVAFNRADVIQFDKNGREVKRTRVDCGGAGCNEVLDNGHVLALSPGFGNIIEFDANGKEIGRFNLPGAAYGFRLPNGNTLVTTEAGMCLEIDRTWKKVIKEIRLAKPAFRVKRY